MAVKRYNRRVANKRKEKRRHIFVIHPIRVKKRADSPFLECEKWWVFAVLMAVGGFYGGFTYSVRGGVFANAQTSNFILLSMHGAKGEWLVALSYLVPIFSYLAGTIFSDAIATPIRRLRIVRWDTVMIFIEMLTVILLGVLPEQAPVQISQILITFVCAMRYHTFRQAQKIPMATTFCTNHLRQTGAALSAWVRHKDRAKRTVAFRHIAMLLLFALGVYLAAVLCQLFLGRAIFFALIPLSVVFVRLLWADLTKERNQLDQIPSGH